MSQISMEPFTLSFDLPGTEAGVTGDATAFRGPLVLPCQTHTVNVAMLPDSGEVGEIPPLPDTDAVISFRTDCAIGVRTADCVPVILHAPDIRAVAAIHAGWRGTLGGIVSLTVEALKKLGADTRLMKAAIGPAISAEHYEVDEELAERFADSGYEDFILRTAAARLHLDLPGINRRQLSASGIPESSIHSSGVCTFSTPALPSWRRTPGTAVRLLTWIRPLP